MTIAESFAEPDMTSENVAFLNIPTLKVTKFAVAMRNGVNSLCWCDLFDRDRFGCRAVLRLNQATLFDSREEAESWVAKVNPFLSGSTAIYFVVPLMDTQEVRDANR